MSKECPKGKIMRIGYTRKNGTVIEPTCIKDMGKPGKGDNILPKLKGDLHLGQYGYAVHKTAESRRQALRKASKDNDTLEVLRRLNLIRNYSQNSRNKEIYNADVEYMKGYYAKVKKRKTKKMRGGNLDDIQTSDEYISREKLCGSDGKCTVDVFVSETHFIDGKEITFQTLQPSEKTVKDINRLNPKLIYTQKYLKQISEEKQSNIIGIIVDDKLEGYFIYTPMKNLKIFIDDFIANPGYRTSLYTFMEKFMRSNNYGIVSYKITTLDEDADKKLTFWMKDHEYTAKNVNPEYIIIEKEL